MNKKVCHLRCDTCKSEAIGKTLEECLNKIECLDDGGPLDDTCKIALKADGKAVFVLDQKIKDGYKGETDLSGEGKKKSPKPLSPAEDSPQDEPADEDSGETEPIE